MGKSNSELNEIYALLKATDKERPAQADITKLQQYLVKYPELSATVGDLAHQVEVHILKNAFSKTQAGAISTAEYCKKLRHDLGYEAAPALERNLIEHIVLCWLRLHLTEIRYEMYMREATAQSEYWEKQLTSNQKRYLRAVETLARVRKLGISVQINVAHQQVVTGG